MKITITHALAATGYIAENYREGLVPATRISKECNIPKDYLMKILLQLVNAQILRSKRGPGGGLSLARDPEEITMLQIIEVVGGPLMRDMPIAELAHNADFALRMESICTKATEKEMEIYDKAKLSDMLK
ncbi:MAG TPA: Rrf2 family transcriptional regulator [Phycisphaerales bacterium]|nr:Rrf2 family transcriptional regulator [Phycisphaerales bacterium]